jgi:hypothetical protein
MELLCNSNLFVFTLFQNIALAFNICLCHDLIRTLKDPFQPGGRRMKIYAIFSVLFGLTFALVSERSSMSKAQTLTCTDRCGIFDQQLLSGQETDAVGEVIYANGNLRSFVYYWS